MPLRSSPFVNVRPGLAAAGPVLCLVLGAGLLLSGCIAAPFREAKVDPRSPVAPEVAKLAHRRAAYPTFAAFPAAPKGLRPVKQYGLDAAAVETSGDRLVRLTAEDTWTIKDTEAFTAQAQIDAGPALPPANPAETEAFAKDQKARAKTPSPVKRQ